MGGEGGGGVIWGGVSYLHICFNRASSVQDKGIGIIDNNNY